MPSTIIPHWRLESLFCLHSHLHLGRCLCLHKRRLPLYPNPGVVLTFLQLGFYYWHLVSFIFFIFFFISEVHCTEDPY